MIRTLALAIVIAAPLGACAGMREAAPKSSVDAVVLDETKRQEAADTAEATASSTAGLESVAEGPKNQEAVP